MQVCASVLTQVFAKSSGGYVKGVLGFPTRDFLVGSCDSWLEFFYLAKIVKLVMEFFWLRYDDMALPPQVGGREGNGNIIPRRGFCEAHM